MLKVNYQDLFEIKKKKEEAKGRVFIILTPDLTIPIQDLMIRHRVKFDDLLSFKNTSNISDNQKAVRGGITAFYQVNNEHKAAVFIMSEFVTFDSEHNNFFLIEAYKYVFLINELAYVNDFENSINFNKESQEADLLKAQVYADINTLKYLTVNNYTFVRALYAERLLGLDSSVGSGSLQIQRDVMKKYPKKKLLQWSKQLSR